MKLRLSPAAPCLPRDYTGARPAHPTPPAWRAQGALLRQALLLAALLHLLVVLVLGNTPGGSARPGEGVWGAFQVRLMGSGPADRPDSSAAASPATGPPGQAERQRFGGAVRPDAALPATDGPGAAQLGRWLPQAAEGDAQAPPQAGATSTDSPPQAVAVSADSPPQTSPPSADPLPSRAELAPRESPDALRPLPLPATAAALTPPPLPRFQVQPPAPPRGVVLRELGTLAGPPAPLPALPALPALPLPAALPLPHFTADAPLPARRLAAAPPLPAVTPLTHADLPGLPAPASPALPSFPVQPAPLPRTVAARDRPAAVTAPATADLQAAPATAPPLPQFTSQAPAVRVQAAPALPPPLPAAAAQDLAPPPLAADRPALPSFAVAPAVALTAAPAVASANAPAVASPATPAQAPANTLAAVPASVPAAPVGVRQVAGAPDAGSQRGHDVASAPSQPASAARLNLDLVRPRGGPIAAQGSRGLLAVVPHPPELKTKLEKDLELSGLADCRRAYSAMGLAAAAPLAADALREKGCRW